MNTLDILNKAVSEVKRKNDYNYESKKEMSGMCSYFACVVMKEIKNLGYESEHLNILINEKALDKSFIPDYGLNDIDYRKEQEYNHNVVLFEGYIVDLSRNQFGRFREHDITPENIYLNRNITVKTKIHSTQLNLG
ncbi:MAG: hypothetical protein CL760_11850 [Chloroflexi bacterium]|nr:hypothetical protein [Chloroflexota bacterium]|tara:strand:+ start:61816 stop:62223 length:408 start_codon:yes stop_codon:yes gene_type:complete